MTTLPRGIRNNNPGNMNRTAKPWNGQSAAQPDPRFASFDSPMWGIRAMMKQFMSYAKRGIDTPREIIGEWAPASENNTAAYISNVSKAMGKTPDTVLDMKDVPTLISLAKAIVHQEQGPGISGYPPAWFPDAVYQQAAYSALTT